MEWLVNFYNSNGVWIFLFIFFAKLIEVSLATIRVILVNRGVRTLGSLLSFVEVLLWVFVAAGVLTGISSSPLKGVIYALGYAAGVYLGSCIENRLAFGKSVLQIIIPKEQAKEVGQAIRDLDVGVTELEGRGYATENQVFLVFAERKTAKHIIDIIKEIAPNAVISASDASVIHGGYLPRRNFSLKK